MAKLLERAGRYSSIQKFIATYAKIKTKKAYRVRLTVYFRWVREAKGVFS